MSGLGPIDSVTVIAGDLDGACHMWRADHGVLVLERGRTPEQMGACFGHWLASATGHGSVTEGTLIELERTESTIPRQGSDQHFRETAPEPA